MFWLTQMHRLATPLARNRVSPNLLSLAGVLTCGLAAVVVWRSVPGALVLAALLIGVAGLADGLDGAVAVLRHRDSPAGAVLDAACDRISDLLLVVTLWLAGAPDVVCVLLGVLFLLHEYLRAVARSIGLRDDTMITVAERPARVIVVAAFLLAGGTAPGRAGELPGDLLSQLPGELSGGANGWPVAGAWCGLVLAAIGIVQLVIWLRRTLA